MLPRVIDSFFDLFRPSYALEQVEELPMALAKHVLYIVGEGPYQWFVAMLCPCGCGETIKLNVRDDAHPYWRIIEREGKVSLEPSIWRQKGCRSHFYLRRNKIQWCGIRRSP